MATGMKQGAQQIKKKDKGRGHNHGNSGRHVLAKGHYEPSTPAGYRQVRMWAQCHQIFWFFSKETEKLNSGAYSGNLQMWTTVVGRPSRGLHDSCYLVFVALCDLLPLVLSRTCDVLLTNRIWPRWRFLFSDVIKVPKQLFCYSSKSRWWWVSLT